MFSMRAIIVRACRFVEQIDEVIGLKSIHKSATEPADWACIGRKQHDQPTPNNRYRQNQSTHGCNCRLHSGDNLVSNVFTDRNPHRSAESPRCPAASKHPAGHCAQIRIQQRPSRSNTSAANTLSANNRRANLATIQSPVHNTASPTPDHLHRDTNHPTPAKLILRQAGFPALDSSQRSRGHAAQYPAY